MCHTLQISGLAQAAFGSPLAIEDEAVGLLGRVRKAVAGFECEDVVAGGGDTQLAAPADRVVVGLNLRNRMGALPVRLDFGLGENGNGPSRPIRRGEELRFQSVAGIEYSARNRYTDTVGQRGALRIENRRSMKLVAHPVQRRDV